MRKRKRKQPFEYPVDLEVFQDKKRKAKRIKIRPHFDSPNVFDKGDKVMEDEEDQHNRLKPGEEEKEKDQ
jgi:hypothetical protein